ncbi:hypothetical protein [Brevibacillus laterosporus]|uniref:hypothetical protein n=2 Tax=Brevibacillus laterosporus TaxID=1465 RepID=UPI002404AE47|nr:hypothetical protein [Brevibacillus laterosporus]
MQIPVDVIFKQKQARMNWLRMKPLRAQINHRSLLDIGWVSQGTRPLFGLSMSMILQGLLTNKQGIVDGDRSE